MMNLLHPPCVFRFAPPLSLILSLWSIAVSTVVFADTAERSTADVIVILGAAGTDEYAQEFHQAAARWQTIAIAAEANFHLIGASHLLADPAAAETTTPEGAGTTEEPATPDKPATPDESATDDKPATTEDLKHLEQTLQQLSTDSSAAVWVVMIGHGTAGPAGARFNLRGPDLTAPQLAQWLAPLNRPLVVVAGFSSSSPFLPSLKGDHRVVITATRSGTEQSFSRFAGLLATAIGDPAADIDHDGEVSILEAFLAASANVRDFYRNEARLQTEHALLDDNGDGLGTAADAFRGTRAIAQAKDSTARLDGDLAATMILAPAADRLPFTEEELAQRQRLESELRDLQRQRPLMAPDEYLSQSKQRLLVLAKLYEAAEQRQHAPISETDQSQADLP